jgi:hypothetical protein
MNENEIPLPFTLRVAAKWKRFEEFKGGEDSIIFFKRKAKLTGTLLLTSQGNDVEISDLGFFNDSNSH